MSRYYKLDDAGQPVACEMPEWAVWFESTRANNERQVARDTFGHVRVSTVFLGLDHGWVPEGPPVLWETLVFEGPLDGEMDRYTSREAALAGHARMVERVRAEGLSS